MESLRDEFLETIVLAEPQGDSVVPIVRVAGLHEMRMNQEVGRHYPAYAGATGQVLLANLPEEQLKAYLKQLLGIAWKRPKRAGLPVAGEQHRGVARSVAAAAFDLDPAEVEPGRKRPQPWRD